MSIGVRVRVSDCSIGDGCFDNSWMRIYHEGGFKAYWIRKYCRAQACFSYGQ